MVRTMVFEMSCLPGFRVAPVSGFFNQQVLVDDYDL